MNTTPRKQLTLILCGVFLNLLLAGCQTLGNGAGNGRALALSPNKVAQAITIDHSTKADVAREFGPAQVYKLASGREVWTYRRNDGPPHFLNYVPVVGLITSSMADRVTEVAFLFDEKGVLRNVDRRGRD